MQQLLFYSDGSYVGFILRLTAGLIMLPHGAQKMLGLFGGYGFAGTMQFLTKTAGLPWLIGFLVILIEFVGAIGLIIGVAGRLWALLFILIMLGAIFTTNYKNGFFMNWFGNQAGEGFEYHLLFIGLSIALLITGSGRYSLDGWLRIFHSSV